jgi:hypothetical protein
LAAKRAMTPTWLYLCIVLILGVTLMTGVISWVWLTFEDKQLPDSLGTVLATIAGGLVGALTMSEVGGRAKRGEAEAGAGVDARDESSA